MVEKEIYIIRHGQTEYNAQGIVQGRGINAPLNATGRAQAKAFFDVYHTVPFDVVYTSSLLRAQQSVELFVANGVQHIVDANLDEISWGDAEGEGSFTDHSAMFNELMAEWKSGNIHYALPGGESPFQLQLRQLKFLESLQKSPHATILIATHGRFIRALMCTLTQTPLSEMDTFEHANLCLYKVHMLKDGRFTIAEHNNQNHLAELTAQ